MQGAMGVSCEGPRRLGVPSAASASFPRGGSLPFIGPTPPWGPWAEGSQVRERESFQKD